jgi:putative membrane protein
MNSPTQIESNPTMLWVIRILSAAIPLVVALLLYLDRIDGLQVGFDTKILPHINAFLNSGTALCLIVGFVFIKKKNINLHRLSMMTAFVLSSLFLVSYVLYHATQPSTSFGGEGLIRGVYFFLLLTHIVLAAGVVPLVLLAIYYAYSNQIEKHKKMVKWTFPIWTYVAITGVLVYLMISPYYS